MIWFFGSSSHSTSIITITHQDLFLYFFKKTPTDEIAHNITESLKNTFLGTK